MLGAHSLLFLANSNSLALASNSPALNSNVHCKPSFFEFQQFNIAEKSHTGIGMFTFFLGQRFPVSKRAQLDVGMPAGRAMLRCPLFRSLLILFGSSANCVGFSYLYHVLPSVFIAQCYGLL